MAKKHGPNKDNLEATRKKFLDIARKEFSSQGYYEASTAKIVEDSGMARGSLYYHFGDKKGLFSAVYQQLMHEMRDSIAEKTAAIPDAWDHFIQSCLACLDFCLERDTRRIIIDVHTALSYAERIEILKQTLLLELHTNLGRLLAQGYFKGHNLHTLSLIIFGIISEGGRSLELADDVQKARDDVADAFVLFMEQARG